MISGAETSQFAAARVLPEWAEAQFLALQTELAASERQRREQAGEIKQRDLKIQKLVLELAYYKRIKFGIKSESLSVEQQDLFLESCNEDRAAITAELAQVQGTTERSRPKPTGRKAIPPELPRIEHHHEPASCTCGHCGAGLIKIGEDVSEQLDVEPARFFVHRHIRPQYACRTCETITAAPVAPALIDGGLAAPGLHAWVLIQKYLDHLPLYRIEKISERHGVGIARSTLAQWVGQLGVALQPLVDRLSELLKQGKVLHADETPVQQLDPGKGKTKRAYMWAYRSNDLERGPPIVVFDYQISRSGQHARNFLAEWRGDLMVDDYGGYKALFQQGVTELACLAHCRRKFFDLHALPGGHPVAEEALRRIGELYGLEAKVATAQAADRLALRQSEALPRLQSLHEWLKAERLRTANGSGLARAIDYTLKRWPAILRYVSRGDIPIDNNPVENAIRPITLGRRN